MPIERPRQQTYVSSWLWWGLAILLGATWLMSSSWGSERLAANVIDRACLGGCAPGVGGHWLGTDNLGRDVWRQLLGGAFTALGGGLAAAGLSLLIGYVLGAVVAWWSRAGERVPWWVLAQAVLTVGYAAFWWRYRPGGSWVLNAPLLLLLGLLLLSVWLCLAGKIMSWPAWLKAGLRSDRLLLYVTEVVSSVPALLLLLALAALAFRPGLGQLILIYVAVRWTGFAVLSLQEVRGVLEQPYILAARGTGVSGWRLLGKHVFPNAFPPLLVKFVLAIAGFILVEGTFSFLGLGLPVEQASWGRVLAQAQQVRGGWWLWLFPGITLIGSILALQLLARRINR